MGDIRENAKERKGTDSNFGGSKLKVAYLFEREDSETSQSSFYLVLSWGNENSFFFLAYQARWVPIY